MIYSHLYPVHLFELLALVEAYIDCYCLKIGFLLRFVLPVQDEFLEYIAV